MDDQLADTVQEYESDQMRPPVAVQRIRRFSAVELSQGQLALAFKQRAASMQCWCTASSSARWAQNRRGSDQATSENKQKKLAGMVKHIRRHQLFK